MIPLFPITSAGVESVEPSWTLLDTITTTSSSSTFNVTIDNSNGLPPNGTGRLIFNIVADQFETDNQIFSINVDSGNTVFDFQSDTEGFERATIQNADLNDYLSTQTNDAGRTLFYGNLNFSAVTTATSGNGFWLRDTGGTASNNTGINSSSFYIYFEATSNSASGGHPIGGIARSPEFTVDSSPSITMVMGRLGAGFVNSAGTFGRLEIWWLTSV